MFKLKSPYRRVTPTSITETHFKMRLDLDTLASCLQKPPEILWFGVCKGNTGLLKKYVKPYAFSRDLFAKTRAFYGSPFFYGYSTYFLCTFYVFLGDTQIHEKTFQKTSKPVLQTSKCITLPLSYHILPPHPSQWLKTDDTSIPKQSTFLGAKLFFHQTNERLLKSQLWLLLQAKQLWI